MRPSFVLVPLAFAAACVPRAEPPPRQPAPAPAPAPTAAPTPPPAPEPIVEDWRDLPLTPGTWTYRQDARGSIALFGRAGADAEFTIRCDRLAGRIFLSRRGAAPGNIPMTIRTSSATRALPVRPTGGTPAYMAVAVAPNDPVLDAMAFSRGRFVVAMTPMPMLVVPAWSEVPRVVEDCRP